MTQTVTATCLGLEPTFGFGDPVGGATPGHVEAMRRAGLGRCRAVFARGNAAQIDGDDRTWDGVMDAAMEGLVQEGFGDIWGAEAGGLTDADAVRAAAEAGFRLFTLDATAAVDTAVDALDEAEVDARFEAADMSLTGWVDAYMNQRIELPSGSQIDLDELTCRRVALKWGAYLTDINGLCESVRAVCGEYEQPFEIGITLDPGTGPATTIVEHYLVGDHLMREADLGEALVVVTPRLVPDAEPGLDWAPGFIPQPALDDDGNPDPDADPPEVPQALLDVEARFADHAAIAAALGPYKLGLHGASGKLSLLPSLGRATGGRCHIATAGGTYLEALRVAAIEEPDLFRRLIEAARAAAGDDATHLPAPADVADDALEATYLELWSDVEPGAGYTLPARRVLHETMATVLANGALATELRELCDEFPGTFRDVVADEFERHIRAVFGG